MQPLRLLDDLALVKLPLKPLHMAIGMFDGVHLGHQCVIEAAVHSARSIQGISAALTFWPHPSELLCPQAPKPMIMAATPKQQRLEQLGVDHVLFKHFDQKFSLMPAEDFLPYLKQSLPALRCLYVGTQFTFGHKRRGTVELLVQQGKSLGVDIVSINPLHYNEAVISSTRIRQALQAGDIALANAMLGAPYENEGTVVSGDQRGRTLGFPTLNIPWQGQLQPRYGVYAVYIQQAGQQSWYKGVANFGVRPTISNSTTPLLEVHVLEPTNLGPSSAVKVRWQAFIRPEAKYPSLEALAKGIARDKQKAIALLA